MNRYQNFHTLPDYINPQVMSINSVRTCHYPDKAGCYYLQFMMQ